MIWTLLIAVFHFSMVDAIIAGLALSFSSTVISLKLIPTTTLHHRRTGEVMISILLFEDILAILTILILYSGGKGLNLDAILLPLKTCVLALCAWWIVRYLVLPLFSKFDIISEYIFLMSLGWCFTAAQAAEWLGLSHEIGAFIAGLQLRHRRLHWLLPKG